LAFVSHPSSLLVLAALLLAWVYVFALHQGPLVVNGRALSDRERFFGMCAGSFVFVFFLTGVGSLAFSALVAAGALCAAHGSMRAPDDLFLDEGGEPGQQGLLAILMGGGGGSGGAAGNV
jgi:PRA1 family protein 1